MTDKNDFDCDCDDEKPVSGKDYFWRCFGTGIMLFLILVGFGSCNLLMDIERINL